LSSVISTSFAIAPTIVANIIAQKAIMLQKIE